MSLAEAPVVDASPLIHLSRAGFLPLLQVIGPRLIVPLPVADEVRAKGEEDLTVRTLVEAAWLVLVPAVPIPAEIATWDLGAGEASVLAWARSHPGSFAILDDLQGRRCASALQVPVVGTLGVVLIAKRRGAIPAARPVLEELLSQGMYLSGPVVEQALALVGE